MTQILRPNPKNGLLGWPDNWTLRRYNGCNEPCDFLVGPCACGAMHDADEEWVQRALEINNALIEYRKPLKPNPHGDALCWLSIIGLVGLIIEFILIEGCR